MDLIPINEQAISPYIGKPVCAVLHDGSCYYGTISQISNGQLILNGGLKGVETVSTSAKKAKTQMTALNNKASVSSFFPGFGLGGAGLAITLGLIALLFAVPFFGFPFFF